MDRTNSSTLLATFLAGTSMPDGEIEDIIRVHFPSEDAEAVIRSVNAQRQS
jgi:hypothetical protein